MVLNKLASFFSVCFFALALAAEETVHAGPKPYSLDSRDNTTVRAGRFDGKVLDLTASDHPCAHAQCNSESRCCILVTMSACTRSMHQTSPKTTLYMFAAMLTSSMETSPFDFQLRRCAW